jgi:hypothetical protein
LSVLEETIVPIEVLPPTVPFTSQVTVVVVAMFELLLLLRLTVAVKFVCAPRATVAELGEMETEFTVTTPDPLHPETANIAALALKNSKIATILPLPMHRAPLVLKCESNNCAMLMQFGGKYLRMLACLSIAMPFSLLVLRDKIASPLKVKVPLSRNQTNADNGYVLPSQISLRIPHSISKIAPQDFTACGAKARPQLA